MASRLSIVGGILFLKARHTSHSLTDTSPSSVWSVVQYPHLVYLNSSVLLKKQDDPSEYAIYLYISYDRCGDFSIPAYNSHQS